jgi:hypothetical protein
VQQTVFDLHDSPQLPQEIAGYLGCCLGIYDRLRAMAGRPTIPAEVAISMLTRGRVQVARSSSPDAVAPGGRLPARSNFPQRTIADAADCTELLNLTVQDLLDAANVRGDSTMSFIYSPS